MTSKDVRLGQGSSTMTREKNMGFSPGPKTTGNDECEIEENALKTVSKSDARKRSGKKTLLSSHAPVERIP